MLSTGWTASMRDAPFDRHQPVPWMNGAKGSPPEPQQSDLERVFLIGRFHRTAPRAVEFLQHFLGRGASAIDNPVQRLDITALLTAKVIGAGPPSQSGIR